MKSTADYCRDSPALTPLSLQKTNESPPAEKPIYPFRRSRTSLQPGRSRARSSSSVHSKQRTPQLLLSCISILTSVVLEDCRYQIALPRPSCPPNALQAVTLDVAQLLLSSNRHAAKTLSQIAFAMIPAFSSFRPEMYTRLLRFFEGCLRDILDDLVQMQGFSGIFSQQIHPQDELYFRPAILNPIEGGGRTASGLPPVSIHVDEAQENPRRDITSSTSMTKKLKSTNAPLQTLSLYYLASVVAPLLGAILESVDLIPSSKTRPEVFHCLYRLLHLIIDVKADTYIDVLQVMGYHSPKARRAAANLLTIFWPKAVGHIIVSRPFPVAPYNAARDVLVSSEWSWEHIHAHQFTPWRFMPQSSSATSVEFSLSDCRSCTKPIQDFGLLCPFCMCAVHFDCYDYPEGSYLVQYASVSDPNVQRVAMYRFSEVLSGRRDAESRLTEKHGHLFRLINLFTLCLCSICRRPLWGCTAQGLNCIKCMQFVHAACLSNATVSELALCATVGVDSDHISIDWEDLRLSCVEFHEVLRLSDKALSDLGYEEISIIFASIWIQLQIIANGIALGSVVVEQNDRNATYPKGYDMHEFELHHALKMCEIHISSDALRCSDTMDDYMQENKLACSEHLLMFDWSNLVYLTSAIKLPYVLPQLSQSSSDFLNVIQPDGLVDHSSDLALQPLEVVPLGHIRNLLRQEFNIHADIAVELILSHLNHLGLLERLDCNTNLNDENSYCIFPLPFGFDISTNVEVLVSAVEGCLSDLDLSVNEVGFLLLVRRLWPNGMTTELAFRRLTHTLLLWILAEVRQNLRAF